MSRDDSADPCSATALTAIERQRLLVEWNDTRVDYPRHLCLHQLFEAQAERTPDADAIVHARRRWSYSEVNRRANELARRLRNSGVGPEVPVALWLDRTAEIVPAILAVLKAGGAYVPLDPAYPSARIELMLADCAPPVIVTDERLAATLPAHRSKVVCVDPAQRTDAKDDVNVASDVSPDSLAYILYTSGSTGQPKGVAIEHHGPAALLAWAHTVFTPPELAGVLASTSICFDLSVFEMFVPLTAGGAVILVENVLALPGLAAAAEVTLINTVPSAMAELLRLGSVPATVRTINLAGEPLKTSLVRKIHDETSVERVYDLYGPSEDTTYSTWALRSPDGPQTIGRPIANTEAYLLDDRGRPVPIGEIGELCLGGEGLARGYLHRPDLTAERFIDHPFSDCPGARLYRTGDLARYLDDGNLVFLGRADHQVKIRGFRIELGEIETALEAYPEITEAVVVAREDQPGEKRLVAYLVVESGGSLNVSRTQAHLEKRLPTYMTPSAFVALEALPRTPNGKVDRKALPAPSNDRPDLEQEFVAPRDPLEEHLTALWCELLALGRVGIHDRFFELGGNSLQAADFINRLQNELGEQIYIVTIFESPSIAEYAAFLKREYPASITRRFGLAVEAPSGVDAATGGKIDEEAVTRMRECIPCLAPTDGDRSDEDPNPPALFVLAPPRSGTTLLRVMLAGNPGLFAAAELQLLGFETLDERRRAYTGKFSLWLEGAIRAVMEIHDCDADEAKRIVGEMEAAGRSTKQLYRELQSRIGDRMLVDKSPSYALDPGALRKAERDFREPIYVHIVRHPYASVRSFESYHLDQVMYLREHDFTSRQVAELIWLISHRNIVEFLKQVPPTRCYRIRFEDLVSRPEETIRKMTDALGLQFHPAMLEPYRDMDKKMTDGIYPASRPMGDTNLLSHRSIDPGVAGKWGEAGDDDSLGEITWELAEALGYGRTNEPRSRRGRAGGQARGGDRRRAALARRRRGSSSTPDGSRDE